MKVKKSLVVLVFGIFLLGFNLVTSASLLTKIEFEISGFSGITSLDNLDGESVTITITNSTDVVVTRNAVAGIYLENMTITMSGAKFNLEYATDYTYNLSTIYGDFLYNFTTPKAPFELHTGQTTSNRTGDDAYHDGTARNDFTRTVQADGNATVTDSLTELMWQDGGTSGSVEWDIAIDYCNDLEWGGFSDWRLPNYLEFASVMNFSTTELNYWPLAFDDRPVGHSWTGTTFGPNSNLAYRARMGYGYLYDHPKDSNHNRARCVRDQ